MNEFRTFIGIDVSKKTFDAALLRSTHQLTTIHQSFDQNTQGYEAFVQWLKSNEVTIGGDVLICLFIAFLIIENLLPADEFKKSFGRAPLLIHFYLWARPAGTRLAANRCWR